MIGAAGNFQKAVLVGFRQGIPLKGIIFNHYKQGDVLHEDNRKMCEYYTGVPVVACVADGDTELSMDAEDLKALYETAEK